MFGIPKFSTLWWGKKLIKFGLKCTKSFIDNKFRAKVIPIEGSVVYCDLYIGAEHSGIYIGNREISNIAVDGFLESIVEVSDPEDFTDKSLLHKKIYVSCNSKGAVGNINVCNGAKKHIGERGFYGLVFKNCHEFSEKCVNYSKKKFSNSFSLGDIDETSEATIKSLKNSAKRKLGATKWLLWDWENDEDEEDKEPDIEKIKSFWENIPLNEENSKILKNELAECKEYIEEITDENLPKQATEILYSFQKELKKIDDKYEEVKKFIKISGCGDYSYNDFLNLGDDFLKLAKEMEDNQKIKDIVYRLGREYISEKKKLISVVNKRTNNEILGIHKSNELTRILPSEMVNFESEELEYLFYSKFLENQLLTYELGNKEQEYHSKIMKSVNEKNKGPVIACLDTSGSMIGLPILKGKALLLSISKILEKENRNLHIILFGSSNEIKELNIEKKEENKKILPFLKQTFNGGTNFETPLKKGIDIIEEKKNYHKADILMITDGLCDLSENFIEILNQKKINLDFSVYTIICGNNIEKDKFSDEILNI